MLFMIDSQLIAILWMITGLIGIFSHTKIRNEIMACLQKSQFFHFFGAILFSLFTSFIFGPLNYLVIYFILKIQSKK